MIDETLGLQRNIKDILTKSKRVKEEKGKRKHKKERI